MILNPESYRKSVKKNITFELKKDTVLQDVMKYWEMGPTFYYISRYK